MFLPGALLIVWYLATAFAPASPYTPRPVRVLTAFEVLVGNGALLTAVPISLGRVLLGFLLASATAALVGLLMGYYPVIEQTLDPLIESCRSVAPIALLPLAILWFGTGSPAAVFIVSYAAFFPMVLNAVAGVRRVSMSMVRVARTVGASEWTIMHQIILPGALPAVLTGARLAMGAAWTSVVAAELAVGAKAGGGGTGGIGQLMFTFYLYNTDPNPIVASMIVVGVVGFALDQMIRLLSRRLTPWAQRS